MVDKQADEFTQKSVEIKIRFCFCGNTLRLKTILTGENISAENVIVGCGKGNLFVFKRAAVVFDDFFGKLHILHCVHAFVLEDNLLRRNADTEQIVFHCFAFGYHFIVALPSRGNIHGVLTGLLVLLLPERNGAVNTPF